MPSRTFRSGDVISFSASFWKAFFDPKDPSHAKARSEIEVYDREDVLLSPFVLSETVGWLLGRRRRKHAAWLLEYAQNTANVRIFAFGKEELSAVMRISAEEGLPLDAASLEYLRKALNCDIKGYR
jgi:predicted nucleic acid-binding protein